jgi:signal transduction histidine kinase
LTRQTIVASLGRWFRPPRHVLTLFLGVTGVLSLTMGWLAWQLIAQDRALAAQRTHERLDNAAETAVTVLRHGLEDIAQRLDALSKLSPGAAPAEFAEQASMLGDETALILAGGRTLDVWPAGRLVYYPPSALARNPPDSTTGLFAAGEELEFQHRDLAGALRAFGPLTRSANPQLQAGALLRIARLWSQLHQPDRALGAYEQLAGLGATLAGDMPAGLLGRYGRCLVLRELGRTEDLRREATALEGVLNASTWRLTRAEYEFYRAQARAWQPATVVSDVKTAPGGSEQLSAAVAAMWDEWDTARASVTPAIGSRLVHADGTTVLVAWHSTAGRVAALVGGPRFIEARLVEPSRAALTRYRARMILADADGHTLGGDAPAGDGRQVQRAAADTRLPWSVRIIDTDPGAEIAATAARSRVVLAGLVALGLFVLAGGTFIVRAVNRELEVSRLQTDFVAAVSHEFRTPLTSIRQVSESLLEGRVPEARRDEYYRMQQRDSERLRRLVESLLDFGRMESGAREYRLEPVDVTVLVRSLADEFSAGVVGAGYRVETTLQSEGMSVSADREAIGRAIWNLLDNAVKYSPSYKTVWLRTAAGDGCVKISVQDRGVGVPPADQRRIFDKFARGANAAATGAKGTGLGLAMVQHIVGAHGGKVQVESKPGDGSTFTITLPSSRGQNPQP